MPGVGIQAHTSESVYWGRVGKVFIGNGPKEVDIGAGTESFAGIGKNDGSYGVVSIGLRHSREQVRDRVLDSLKAHGKWVSWSLNYLSY